MVTKASVHSVICSNHVLFPYGLLIFPGIPTSPATNTGNMWLYGFVKSA